MQGKVKAHTRKSKNGAQYAVKTFTRKSSGSGRHALGRLGTTTKGAEFMQHVHNQFLSSKEQSAAKKDGHVLHKSGNVFNYDKERNDFYITPGIKELSSTAGVKKEKDFRVYLKKNRRSVLHDLLT